MSDFDQFISRICTQTAVYWENQGPDGYGQNTYADPVELNCRWSQIKELVHTEQGKEVVSEAQVLLTQDVSEQSMLYLGSLSDLDSDQEVEPLKATAYKIIRFRKVPSIDGSSYLRKAYL